VKLASSNPFDDPIIDPGYLSHPFDIQALTEGIRTTKRWFNSTAWDGLITSFLGPDPDNSTLSETAFQTALKESAGTFLHPVGTAAMSSSASNNGVVDNKLRLKGVHGLRVVDASVIVSGFEFYRAFHNAADLPNSLALSIPQ
jgi:choline dehydrogenase